VLQATFLIAVPQTPFMQQVVWFLLCDFEEHQEF
jgi:hypothetical protein